ncbi:MAG: hypothetical protein AB1516_02860 [Pseudomonadota bacterium]
MPPSPSEVRNSPALPSQNVVAPNTAKPFQNEGPANTAGVSKAALALWKKLSASLADNPSAHWNQALSTADELARSVCGQNLPMDLQADLLGNFNLLEQTLSELKIPSSDELPDPQAFIKTRLTVMRLSIVTDAEDLRRLQSLRTHSSN